MKANELIRQLTGIKRSGNGWIARCPAHEDRTPSLSIKEQGDKLLLKCHAGCSFESILSAVDLGPGVVSSAHERSATVVSSKKAACGKSVVPRRTANVAEYSYTNEAGELVFQVVRQRLEYSDGKTAKKFVARRKPRDGESAGPDGWIYNRNGVELTLYNLTAVAAADTVYVVEGEKDVQTLASYGLTATCNPFGAGKWRHEFSASLAGKDVVIIPDNDEPGRRHAENIAASLDGIARRIRVIEIPGLEEKGDVTDFFLDGGTAEELGRIVARTQVRLKSVETAALQQQKTSRFNFCSVAELLTEKPEQISFVWANTLPSGGFSIMSAKPKVGKSTVARNLCKAVASGESFLGRETFCGTVLYLCLEEKRSEVQDHFRRMGVGGERILIHTGVTPSQPFDGLAVALAEHQPSLVVIDPLSRILRVSDFNDYGGMARGLEPLIDLARASGSHIMAVHHDVKQERRGGDSILGSTALFGAVDCHLGIRMRNGTRILATSQRYGENFPETVLQLDRETGIVTSLGDLPAITVTDAKKAVLAAIGDEEILVQEEIKARVSGFVNGAISKALNLLVEQGDLIRLGQGVRRSPYLYSKKLPAEK